MLTIYLQGGLGNQLFQIFTLLNYSLKFNKDYFIPKELIGNRIIGNTKRKTYWDNLFMNCKLENDFDKKIRGFNKIEENTFNEKNIKDNTLFYGYYQDDKYFKENYQKILNLLEFDKIKKEIKEKYIHYLKNKTISLHFRLGDYKEKQKFHPLVKIEYYKKCLESFNENYDVLYFCEKEDNDLVLEIIKGLKKDNLNFIKVSDEIEDWEQLLLMSLCNHNIIANSSFSWWGAYLNDNLDKKVYYPSNWFGEKDNRTYKIKDWIKI